MHPVLVAGIAHYELVRIHPFVDGNGRTARALATLILTMREFDIKRFFTLNDFYDSDRNAYYAVLKRVNGTWPDCTVRLDYFLKGVEISLHRVKERVLLLSSDEHRKVAGGQVALSERQIKIIEFIHVKVLFYGLFIIGLVIFLGAFFWTVLSPADIKNNL